MKNKTQKAKHSGENSQRPVGLLRGRLRYGGQAWLLRHQGVHHGAGEGVVGGRRGWWERRWWRGRKEGVVESSVTESGSKVICGGGGEGVVQESKWGSCGVRGDGEWW